VGEAVCDSLTLVSACRNAFGERGDLSQSVGRVLGQDSIAAAGLLRSLARAKWEEVTGLTGLSETTARRALGHHRHLLREDPAYQKRVAEIVVTALEQCHGR